MEAAKRGCQAPAGAGGTRPQLIGFGIWSRTTSVTLFLYKSGTYGVSSWRSQRPAACRPVTVKVVRWYPCRLGTAPFRPHHFVASPIAVPRAQERTGTVPRRYRSREFVEGQEISFLFAEDFLQRD